MLFRRWVVIRVCHWLRHSLTGSATLFFVRRIFGYMARAVDARALGVVCVCGEQTHSKAQPYGRKGGEAYLYVLVA